MNINDLLKQVKGARTKRAGDETVSNIPQELLVDPATELPKNIVTEGQAGDEQKVMELLEAIEQGGEVKGAAESIMTAKIAEEMAALDQVIIEKQAEHFGVKMAEAFAQRLIEINNPPISEKQAEEMVKAASEEEYARWFNAGTALWDGYVTKAAEFGTDGGAGIIDNGGEAVPSAVNQSEVDVFANNLAGYLASEFGGEGEDGKSASEKQAKFSNPIALAKRIAKYVGTSMGGAVENAGISIANRVNMRAGNKLIDAARYIDKHPRLFGAGVIGAGTGAAGYAGYKYGPDAYNRIVGKKQSSDAGAILNAFTTGVITKKQAAEKLLSLK
jgi:hypothetical protein